MDGLSRLPAAVQLVSPDLTALQELQEVSPHNSDPVKFTSLKGIIEDLEGCMLLEHVSVPTHAPHTLHDVGHAQFGV